VLLGGAHHAGVGLVVVLLGEDLGHHLDARELGLDGLDEGVHAQLVVGLGVAGDHDLALAPQGLAQGAGGELALLHVVRGHEGHLARAGVAGEGHDGDLPLHGRLDRLHEAGVIDGAQGDARRALAGDLLEHGDLLVQVVLGGPLVDGLHPELPGRVLEALEGRHPVLHAGHEGAHVVGLVGRSRELLVLDLGKSG